MLLLKDISLRAVLCLALTASLFGCASYANEIRHPRIKRAALTSALPATSQTTTNRLSTITSPSTTLTTTTKPTTATTMATTITTAARSTLTTAPSSTTTKAVTTSTITAATTMTTKPIATSTSPVTTVSTSGCPSPSYPPTHTACLNMSSYAASPRGVTADEKKQIVDLHNYLRSLQPATDMQRLVWDDEVAYVAQAWSNYCNYSHDSQRYIPNKYSAGQNIAYGFRTWNSTIMAWYNETSQFTYGNTTYNFGAIGHYTQIVWNSTAKIGCGATNCTNLGAIFYVCNYAPAGNYASRIPWPYTKGTSCAACPGRCNNSLCDCGGLVCKNGGTLDLNTCKCTCQSPYTGLPDCNLNCTGVADPSYCGSQWPPSYCSQYSNVPFVCPFMCSVCPGI